MSGVLALVAPTGAEVAVEVMDALTPPLRLCGPHRFDQRVDGGVGLAPALLASDPITANEVMPLSLNGMVWVTADVRLDTREELKELLRRAIFDRVPDSVVGGWLRAATGGLDTQVGPSGGLLSTGERQRLALARALLRRPRLLILDEPTSAVDPEAEREILAALQGLRGETTTLHITHRDQAAQAADRVYRMQAGVVRPYST